jgi:hypothetical protein
MKIKTIILFLILIATNISQAQFSYSENCNFGIYTFTKKESYEHEAKLQLPDYPNSFLEVKYDQARQEWLWNFWISRTDLRNFKAPPEMTPRTLPDGRPIHMFGDSVGNGFVPSLVYTDPFQNYFIMYHTENALGIFLPEFYDIGGNIINSRYFYKKLNIGNISIIGSSKQYQHPGILPILKLEFLKRIPKNCKGVN